MPIASAAGGSNAPMENSPPGIHTIPWGDGAGGGVAMGMVGPKAAASAASVIGSSASPLGRPKRGHGRKTPIAISAGAIASTIKIHNKRLGVEHVCAVLSEFRPFFMWHSPLRSMGGRLSSSQPRGQVATWELSKATVVLVACVTYRPWAERIRHGTVSSDSSRPTNSALN
jgi:hypothetical protein